MPYYSINLAINQTFENEKNSKTIKLIGNKKPQLVFMAFIKTQYFFQ
jgi:hypothetical protein